MSGRVERRIRLPSRVNVESARPVRGFDISEIGTAANHVLGAGATLVPGYAPMRTLTSTQTATFRFKVWPQYQNLVRIWSLRIALQDIAFLGTNPTFTVKTPHGASGVDYTVHGFFNISFNFVHIETLSSQSASVTDASIAITNNSAIDARIEHIGCYALPRTSLVSNDNEDGIDAAQLRAPLPIIDINNASFGGLLTTVAAMETTPRRCGLAGWAVDTSDARVLNNGDRLFIDANGPIFLARKLYRTSTTGTVTFYAYCQTSTAATAGNLVLTADSGATANIAIPINSNAAFAWFSTTLAVDAEDLDQVDGLRSSRWDHIDCTFSRTAGAGTLSVASLSAGEA